LWWCQAEAVGPRGPGPGPGPAERPGAVQIVGDMAETAPSGRVGALDIEQYREAYQPLMNIL